MSWIPVWMRHEEGRTCSSRCGPGAKSRCDWEGYREGSEKLQVEPGLRQVGENDSSLQSLEKLFEGVHFRRGYDLAFSSTPSGGLAVQVGGTEVLPPPTRPGPRRNLPIYVLLLPPAAIPRFPSTASPPVFKPLPFYPPLPQRQRLQALSEVEHEFSRAYLTALDRSDHSGNGGELGCLKERAWGSSSLVRA